MDRDTRRTFAIVLFVLVVGVGVATALLQGSPSGVGEGPSGTTAVDGVIVGVDAEGLGDVRSFDLRLGDGSVRTFGLSALENGVEFPPGHLAEHQLTAEPVRVWYRSEGDEDLAIQLDDAPA